MTKIQSKILEYIKICCEKGIPPTVREINDYMGYRSTNSARGNLKALRNQGYITWEPFKSRTMRPTGKTKSNVGKISDSIPTNLVQIGFYKIGKEVHIEGKYYHNQVWIETTGGEGGFFPLPAFEKVVREFYEEHF